MKAERSFLRRGDVVIYAVLIALCVLLFLLPLRQKNRPVQAQILVGGDVVEEIDLSAVETPYTLQIAGCTIAVEQGTIRFADADCPDKVCVRTGSLFRAGSSAACVPNRVVIRLRAANEPYDVVAY